MPPSSLVIRYPFRVRGVSQDGEFFQLDHLEVDLGEAGIALPTVRVEVEGVSDSQRAYLEAAAESAAVQAFVQVAIQVSIATPASTRLATSTPDLPAPALHPRAPSTKSIDNEGLTTAWS